MYWPHQQGDADNENALATESRVVPWKYDL